MPNKVDLILEFRVPLYSQFKVIVACQEQGYMWYIHYDIPLHDIRLTSTFYLIHFFAPSLFPITVLSGF